MGRVAWAEPVDPKRAALMGRVRQRGTAPEIALRKALWLQGCRFRCNVRTLPGWPDIANKRARVAVFVDGCFWHACPRHSTLPKTRRDYWTAKLARNQERRVEVRNALQGWTVFEVFECELRERRETIAAGIAQAVKASAGKKATP